MWWFSSIHIMWNECFIHAACHRKGRMCVSKYCIFIEVIIFVLYLLEKKKSEALAQAESSDEGWGAPFGRSYPGHKWGGNISSWVTQRRIVSWVPDFISVESYHDMIYQQCILRIVYTPCYCVKKDQIWKVERRPKKLRGKTSHCDTRSDFLNQLAMRVMT